MERRRAAGALLALAACILCTAAAPTASDHTSLDLYDGETAGCYYNFQHYGEGDRIMTNEPCLNCTCHNRMLMCYLRVCPFTKPIGQDCTVEKRADQCCPIITCPDVPVDLLTLTSTTSPAEYGATGLGKLDKYGCSINGKYFPEGSKVPPTPNKPCEHCYCIRNMTTCVMQECTLHVDGCTPIYHKDVCCPVRYSCDHPEDEILLLDDKTTTVRPTPGFLLTTTTNSPVTQFTQDCVHDDQIFSDGALIKTEKACEHCYCMKGDIVCVVQECGTPMENEGKNCTSLPPREGQCCPDTYICEGDELNTEYPMDLTTELFIEDLTTLSPPRRVGVEGSGYRKEPDNIGYLEPHPTESVHEGSGDTHETGQTVDVSDVYATEDVTKYTSSTAPSIEIIDKGDSEQATSMKPSGETPSSTDAYVPIDDEKATTILDRGQQIKHEEITEIDKTEGTTSSIPPYDHKLDTDQPETQYVTENEIDIHDDKITLTTITSTLEEEEVTTVKSHEENIVTDTITNQYNKYTTTSPVPILEDEGITTESEREQQTISIGAIEEHSYESGLHTASTTSAPFLEEVEGIPTGTHEQNFVTDGITESDIYDSTRDKTEIITTPASEDSDNLIESNKYEDVESTKTPELDSHDLSHLTTIVPALEEVEKTSTAFPIDLTTSKFSEETHEGDKLIPTSTYQPISAENEENLKERPATTEIPDSLDSQKLDIETEKSQTEKYDQVTDEKTYDDHADISSTSSSPITDDKEEEVIKASDEPVTVSNEVVGSEFVDADKQISIPTSVPIHDDSLFTTENKDTYKPQVQDGDVSTKPDYIEDGERATTQETSYDISTEKTFEQESYESQKPSSTSAPITEEIEMATTEFIKDQDFVTTALIEQESLKPSDYVPSTSSTPFLEEIERLTTEISQGHVVTDLIKEKEDLPQKHVTSAIVTSLPTETADITTAEPDKILNAIPSGIAEAEKSSEAPVHDIQTTHANDFKEEDKPYYEETSDKYYNPDIVTTITSSLPDDAIVKEDKVVTTTEPSPRKEDKHHVEVESSEKPELVTEISDKRYPTTESLDLQETISPSQVPSAESHDIHENIPIQELTTETSRIEENTPEKEIKPEVEEEVTLTTQITSTLPAITTINLGENEIDEDNILLPGRIPGEGDCLLNGATYRNESVVPSTNKCHSDCRCISSIIKCSPIICSSPPEYMDNCQPTYDSPDSCCPTYVCDQLRETLPPMPHIQITTEIPQQTTSTECRGDQCIIEEEKIQPSVSSELCANKDCGSEIDKKTDIGSCGPHGCTEPSSTSELCTDGKCTPVSDECVNGDCKHLPDIVSLEGQCEGQNCEYSPANLPHAPECDNGVCKGQKVPEKIPVPVACTEEGGCKETELNVVEDCTDDTCRRKETLDIEAKPSSCVGPNCDQHTLQVAIETSTLGETFEIKTESPELHVSNAVTTETAIHQTIAPEKQDFTTEINDYVTTISIGSTQQTDQTSEIERHEDTTSLVIQEEQKLPESMFIDQESVTETHTKSPKLDSEHDIVATKIPEEYVTDSYPIDTGAPQMPTEMQPIFETTKSDDSEYTQYSPGTEEHTVKVVTDEEIPTKQLTTVKSDDILPTTFAPKPSESEKYTTEQVEQSISEVTEEQVIESQERTTLPEFVVEHDEYTQVPIYTVPKSEDVTIQPAVVTSEKITTEYQSVPEYQTEPKATTLSPTELYTTVKESDETVTESKIHKGDDELYTHSHVSTTETQAVSLESSTKDNIEAYLPDVTKASEEHVFPTESSGAVTDHDLKTTYVTEESRTPSEIDKIQDTGKDHFMGTEMPEVSMTETAYFTTEPSTKQHEAYTEHGLHISLPEEDNVTEIQKETDEYSTPQPIIDIHKITEGIISEHEVEQQHEDTEFSSSVPHKIEEETSTITPGYGISTETSEFFATTDLDRTTAKPHDTEQESTQTEKSETESSHDTELVTDISMEGVTIPVQTTKLPEILSHKKEHSSESSIVSESETEKSTVAEDITTEKQEESSPDKILTTVTADTEAQTEKPGTLTEESYTQIMKDETTETEITKEKTEKPVLIPQEISTEDIYDSDLEKSTDHGETITTLPESHETEIYTPGKAEQTTILTPIEKDTASDIPEVNPVTDKYDVDANVDKVETSTDKKLSEYTVPQSYAPETQEPEISYTEKAQTISSESTTKLIEAFTTEQSQVLTDMSTMAVPDMDTIVTEKEVQTPEIQETTGVSMVDIPKDDELMTVTPGQYNIEEDLGTKIQDGLQQELTTNIPETHASTPSDLSSSISPELIPVTLVTESQDISKVSDEVQVTEFQIPVTEFEHQHSKDATQSPTEVTKTQSEHSESPDFHASTVETLSTDREEITLSSAAPHVTEIEGDDITESPNKVITLPESSSIKSEEESTSLAADDVSEHGGSQTTLSVPSTEEPVEVSSPIQDSEKDEHKDAKTPELIANVEIVTPFDESHTVPQETATEKIGVEVSTEPALQLTSESHDNDKLTESTSVPMYEVPETTPYLIELQEHTHKNIQEVTTSTPIEEEITTEQTVPAGIEHDHAVQKTTTEAIVDKQTEVKESTEHYGELSTPLEISEKSTQPTISKDEESLLTTQSAEMDIKETTVYKDHQDQKDFTTSSPIKGTEIEKESTPESTVSDNVEKIIITSEKPIQSDITVEITTPEELNILSTEKSSTLTAEELPTQAPVSVDKITKPEEKPSELPPPLPDLSKPSPSNIQPTDEVPTPDEEAHFPPSESSGYGNEPDYVEEDQAFGPGTCRYGGKVYVSAQQIPRDDPCDFCFCFRSDIICLQQSCPPPIHGCHEEPIQGFCCPRYECPVSMATTLNVTTTTTTTTTTLPPHFPTHSYKGAAQRRGCQIKGHTYKVGEVVRGSSGPCLHCTCGGDGQMKCDPKACTPEPMLRQMIAAAVSAKRRR